MSLYHHFKCQISKAKPGINTLRFNFTTKLKYAWQSLMLKYATQY